MRPHLQNIDNVPLLVPLFTDCTPESEYRRGTWAGRAGEPRGLELWVCPF